MRNEFRKDLISQLSHMAAQISNPSVCNAYPQMQPVLMNLGCMLETMAKSVLREEAESMLYGRTPWAILYEKMYGRTISISPLVVGTVLPDQYFGSHYPVPLKSIVDYWFKYRGPLLPEDHTVSTLFEIDDFTIAVNMEAFSAVAHYVGSDMVVEIPDVCKSSGFVKCPLFHDSIEIGLSDGFLNQLRTAIYNRFVDESDLEVLKDTDPEKFIVHKYFGKAKDDFKELPDDHPYFKLYDLLNSATYCKVSSHCDVEINDDYTIRLIAKVLWNTNVTKCIVVDRIFRKIPTDTGYRLDALSHSNVNPLLFSDIIASLDDIIDRALDIHDSVL